MHIFSPIDLKYTKLQKKAENLGTYNFQWGKKYKSRRGGGQKYEFQI